MGREVKRVRTVKSIAGRFWSKVDTSENNPTGCWVWTASTSGAYGQFYVNPKKKIARAHRVAWELHYGEVPAGLMICHHCDNPRCVRPDHLFAGDAAANSNDAKSKGRLFQFRAPEVRIDNRQLPLRLVG